MNHRLLLPLVVLLCSPLCRAAEPLYAGKPLAFWLDELKSEDPLIREEAILVLTDAGAAARAATPRLQELVKDRQRGVRIRAALALWRIAGQTKPAVAELTEALRDPALPNRAEMLSHLGQLGPDAATNAAIVLPFLDDADASVRTQAWMTMQRFGAAAVPSILPLFNRADARTRQSACHALNLLGPSAKEAVPKLTALLEDTDVEVRQDVLATLGHIGGAAGSATPAILKLTHEKDARLRAASLLALRQVFADPKLARPAAQEGLEDDNPLVRVRAVLLLGYVAPRHPDILPHVLELLKQPVGRGELIELLGQMGPFASRSVPALTKLLADSDTPLRGQVIQTLGRIGPASRPATDEMIQQLRSADFAIRQNVVTALRAIGGDGARIVPALLEISKQDLTTRSMIMPLLADYGPKAAAAVPWLVEQLHGQPSFVIVQAAETLHKIDAERAGKEAVPVLQKMIQPAGPLRVYAAMALRRIQPNSEEALKTLIECVAGSDVNVRQQACQFLGTLGKSARAAAPALRKTLSDAAIANRVAAAGALWKITGETETTAPVLLEALKPTPGNYWRHPAAILLGEMGPAVKAAALPVLRKYQDDADLAVRGGVRKAIELLEKSATKPKTP
jgi:HEAT repeat protein